MTLDTRIYVNSKVDVKELFHYGQWLLHAMDDAEDRARRVPGRQRWRDKAMTICTVDGWVDDPSGVRMIYNEMGQGLPAALDITYRVGGPVKVSADECDRYCSTPCDMGSPHKPAHWCEISLDTAYSYSNPSIGGCTELHVELMRGFDDWLSGRDVTFSWKNEYTGDVHPWPEGLEQFGKNGASASAWYLDTARPAIAAHILSEQG